MKEPPKNQILRGLKRIRRERKLTQSELADILGLSQQRLSEIERGKGSITAEQLITLIGKFNLPLSFFVESPKADPETELQNALARLGATHLREIPWVYVPEKYNDLTELIFTTLAISSSSRSIVALAPVIVKNFPRINFALLEKKFHDFGRENRWWWLLDNTLQATKIRLGKYLPRALKFQYLRAETTLENLLAFKKSQRQEKQDETEDLFDTDIASQKTLEIVKKRRDETAKRWNLITGIKQIDFEDALKQAEEP